MPLHKTKYPVRIFSVDPRYGTDNPYTLADLNNAVENWKRYQRASLPGWNNPQAAYLPKADIGIGHYDQGNAVLKALLNNTALPSAGEPSNLWVSGLDLFAELANVPEPVAAMCDNGQFKNISCEFYPNYIGPNGKRFGATLKRISLLGAANPRLKGLGKIPPFVSQEPNANGRKVPQNYVTVFSEFQTMTREEAIEICKAAFPDLEITDQVPDAWIILVAGQIKQVVPAIAETETQTQTDSQANGYPAMTPDVFSERVYANISKRIANDTARALLPIQTRLAEMNSTFGSIVANTDLQECEVFAEKHTSQLYPYELDKSGAGYIVSRLMKMPKDVRKSEMDVIANRPNLDNFSERMAANDQGETEHRKIVGTGTDAPSPERLASLRAHSKIGQGIERNRQRAALRN